MKTECWCYLMGKTVNVEGDIVMHRQADVLRIKDCTFLVDHKACPFRFSKDCLIGKDKESTWSVRLNIIKRKKGEK